MSALLFLYRNVLGQALPWLDDMVHAKRPVRLPVVLSPGEVEALLSHLRGVHLLMAGLLYGAGLRLMECLRLRVKDVDFSYRQILIRDGKEGKDRVTMLPAQLVQTLQAHLGEVSRLFRIDLRDGYGEAYLTSKITGVDSLLRFTRRGRGISSTSHGG